MSYFLSVLPKFNAPQKRSARAVECPRASRLPWFVVRLSPVPGQRPANLPSLSQTATDGSSAPVEARDVRRQELTPVSGDLVETGVLRRSCRLRAPRLRLASWIW